MTESLLIKNATVVTMDGANSIFEGDVYIERGRINAIGPPSPNRADETIDARGRVLMPGFVQTHVHLCQTLFRGAADDLSLIDWLKKRIWPMEARHTRDSLFASAQLAIAEMIRGGTTAALTMETVHHTEAVIEAVEQSGFRATVGKCLMDKGEGVPPELHEKTDESIAEAQRLANLVGAKGKRTNGRLRYCFAPRFAVSCTRELLEWVARASREMGIMIHTHASENTEEIRIVERETGRRNIEYLSDVGLVGPQVVLAHCIWVNDAEIEILRDTGTHVAHCPSSNLKLGSGIAPVPEMIERGVSVSLGADGAPCNNRLDMFTEMRTAAIIQKARLGPETLPALAALRMATVQGARALGLASEIGSIEVGKRADLTLLNLNQMHTTPRPDVVSTIVYAADARNVEMVIIDGRVVMREGELMTLDESLVLTRAEEQAARLS